MAVESNALASLDEVKSFLGISGTTNDDLLEMLINRVTGLFEGYCDRKFAAADYTEYHDGEGGWILYPKQWPVNSIASIHDDTDWAWGADTLIDADDYKIMNESMIALKAGYFGEGRQNIKIVYNAGYAAVPEDLAQAAVEQAAWVFKQSNPGGGMLGVAGKTLADGSVSYTQKDLLPTVKMVLDKYARVNIA